MARLVKYGHNKVVIGSQDAGKQVSKNEWNDGHNELGMFGHGTVTTLTIATGAIVPINSMHIVDGQGASDDNLDNLTVTETSDRDELWLIKGGQVITVRDNSVSSGNIFLLNGSTSILDANKPMRLIRSGANWYEFSGGGKGTFLDSKFIIQDDVDVSKEWDTQLSGATISTKTTLAFSQTLNRTITYPDATDTLVGKDTTDVFTNKTINLTNNTLTGTKAQFDTALSDDSFAYLGQANTFTQDITMSGADILLGVNSLQTANYEIFETGAILTFRHKTATSNSIIDIVGRDTTSGVGALFIKSGDGTTAARWAYIENATLETVPQSWRVGMLGSKILQIRDETNSANVISITNGANPTMDFNSRAVSNLKIADSLDADGNALINVSSMTTGSVSSIGDIRPLLTFANQGTAFRIQSNNASDVQTTRFSVTGGFDQATINILNADFDIVAGDLTMTAGDILLEDNNLDFTTYRINKSVNDFSTSILLLQPHTANTRASIAIAPSGTSSFSQLDIHANSNITGDMEVLTIGFFTDKYVIDTDQRNAGVIRPIHIRMNGQDQMVFNVNQTLNFNSRSVFNLTLGTTLDANNQIIDNVLNLKIGTNGLIRETGSRIEFRNDADTAFIGIKCGNADINVIRDQSGAQYIALASSILTYTEGRNEAFGTTTGTKHGTSFTQKQAWWNVTPVIQPAHIIDADGTLADITTKFNTLLAQMATTGLQKAS